ncbi:MAG: CHAP domain-containing protein [Candidatus Sericytochromatia bacterium]|nr:CHAP domain-containing protein [Candidatus Sericytochromatia bacterium]
MGNVSLPRQPQPTVVPVQPNPASQNRPAVGPVNTQAPPATPPFVGPQPAPGSAPFEVNVPQSTLEQSILKEARADFTFLANESDREVLDFEQRVTLIKINHQNSVGDRADAVGDFFTELVEAGEVKQAQQLLHAFPDLPDLQKGLHGALINDLMDKGKYNQALEINAEFPDAQTQAKNVEYIVRYLIENGETIAAAQAQGEGSLSGVLKAEWDSAMHKVETKYESVVNSVKDLLFGETKAQELADLAREDIGNHYRAGWLGGGTLACAYTVSRIFDNVPELDKVDSAEVNSLVNQMLSKGNFEQVHGDPRNKARSISASAELKPGDVVVFNRPRKQGYGHIGVVSRIREDGTALMVHNSSSKRQVVEVPVNRYNGRMPTGVFRLKD